MNVKQFVTKDVVTPIACKSETDLLKLIISEAMYQTDIGGDEAEGLVARLKVILHDYLALVLAGKMQPLKCGTPSTQDKEMFKQLFNTMDNIASLSGVPMKENEKGELEYDIEEIKRKNDIMRKENI